MRYQPPYGVSDRTRPYINGDPSHGRQGSIPPAAAFEQPQRELVGLIAKSGFTPSDTNLLQLARRRALAAAQLRASTPATQVNNHHRRLRPADHRRIIAPA